MSLTSIIVICVIGLAAIAYLVEAARKASSRSGDTPEEEAADPEPITADEAGPTQTGRYRVQEMLRQTQPDEPEFEEDQGEEEEPLSDLEEDLPDPFDR